MQVLEVHHAFLSNYEVQDHLNQEVRQQQQAIKAFKKANPNKGGYSHEPQPGKPYFDFQANLSKIVPDNVRTLQVETLSYLYQSDLPRYRKKKFLNALDAINKIKALPDEEGVPGGNELTKTEKLMMVNLAPSRLVDLTVICDELEARFSPEAIEQMLDIFRDSTQGPSQGPEADPEDEDVMDETIEEEEEERQEVYADLQVEENIRQVYGDDDVDESAIMPDEENDLIDEGAGDGGRDAMIREIDEAADGE